MSLLRLPLPGSPALSLELATLAVLLARDHAVEDGDISLQSVVFFNDVAFRVAALVARDCERQQIPDQDIRIILMMLDSVGTLDNGLGMQKLTSMIPLLKAEAHTVAGQWEEAIALFDVFLADSSVQPHARLVPKFLSQRAYCKVRSGDTAGALRDVDRSIVASVACTDMDDLFVLHSRASQVLGALGKADPSSAHMESAARCRTSHLLTQSEIMSALEPLVGHIESRRAQQTKNPA